MSKSIVHDITVGNPAAMLIKFALPIMVGNLFQQLYNIADTIIVGNTIGAEAVAAVGAVGGITFLVVAVSTGLAIGSAVLVAQLFGAKQLCDMKSAIYTSLITLCAAGVLLMAAGLIFLDLILHALQTPVDVYQGARDYLQWYLYGTMFVFMYNAATASFNALGSSRIPLYFLIASSLLNVGLDLWFIISFKWGVAGAAIATTISQALAGTAICVLLLVRLNKLKTDQPHKLYSLPLLVRMSKIAIPSLIQQSIVSFGHVFIQALVNGYGSIVIAGFTAASKVDSVAFAFIINMGNALSTFTAQNIGAGKYERVKQGFKTGAVMITIVALSIAGAFFAFGEQFIGLFVDAGANADIISIGLQYVHTVAIFYVFAGVMIAANGVLRGAGDINFAMMGTLINFVIRIASAYALATFTGASAIWVSIPIGWFVGMLISTLRFARGKWKTKALVAPCPVPSLD